MSLSGKETKMMKVINPKKVDLLRVLVASDVKNFSPSPGEIAKESYQLLKREICSDDDPKWPELRVQHLSAGVASRTLKKNVFGAGGYGSMAALLRWYKEPEYRKKEQDRLDNNPYCQHGKNFQSEGAAFYSAYTGYTLAQLGFISGPLEESAGFDAVPEFLSATFDYVVLDKPIIVEIKCPQKEHADWKQKYWVQCQHQLQLARFKELHLVLYFPPTRHDKGKLIIRVIKLDNLWFRTAIPHYERFWKLVKGQVYFVCSFDLD